MKKYLMKKWIKIFNIIFKIYIIIEMPLVLNINTNLNEFDYMIDNKQFINALFKNKIELIRANYKLIGLVTQP